MRVIGVITKFDINWGLNFRPIHIFLEKCYMYIYSLFEQQLNIRGLYKPIDLILFINQGCFRFSDHKLIKKYHITVLFD